MGHLWDALSDAYDVLGFDAAAGGDGVFVSWCWAGGTLPARPSRRKTCTSRCAPTASGVDSGRPGLVYRSIMAYVKELHPRGHLILDVAGEGRRVTQLTIVGPIEFLLEKQRCEQAELDRQQEEQRRAWEAAAAEQQRLKAEADAGWLRFVEQCERTSKAPIQEADNDGPLTVEAHGPHLCATCCRPLA
jgi:hypothetical protein